MFDRGRADAKRQRAVAVDAYGDLRTVVLQVRGHIGDQGDVAQLGGKLLGAAVQRRHVVALQRELIERFRAAAADPDARRILNEHAQSGNPRQAARQLLDHHIGGRTLIGRLEDDVQLPLVGVRYRRHVAGHVGVARQCRHRQLLQPHHLGERRALRRLRRTVEQARVVAREQAFWNHGEQHAGGDEDECREDQGERPVIHRPAKAPLVPVKHALEDALARSEPTPVPHVALRLQEAGAQHRRQCQRHEARDENRHRDRNCKLTKQAPDDPTHEDEGDEHGGEGEGHRENGEAHLLRAVKRRLERRLSHLEVTDDVLEHHDRIVDDKTDGERQRHEREIVDAEAEHIHHREGADHRHRQREARDHRRDDVPEEEEDDEHDQAECQEERELHVAHGLLDSHRPVITDVHCHRWGECELDLLERGLHRAGDGNGVRARLAGDREHDRALAIVPAGVLVVLDVVVNRAEIAQ